MCDLLQWLFRYFCGQAKFNFTTLQTDSTTIKGKINMVKLEFDQYAIFTAENPVDRRGNPAKIETGSATWTVEATDADGYPVDDVEVAPDPTNELSAKLTTGTTECTGTITLRADGDPDTDEEAAIVATASFVVDASNVVAFSLTNSDPQDV